MAKTLELLRDLGFGEYEARAYVALLQRSPLNGYELAKGSKVPRANIYAILQKLEERGAVVRLDTPNGIRYAPVAPAEFTHHLEQRFEETLTAAKGRLERISAPVEQEHIWNIRGYSPFLEHSRALIGGAVKHLAIALWPDESQSLAVDLASTHARGVQVTTLCMAGCVQECGNCTGRIFRYQVLPEQASRWLVLVSDRPEMMAGEIGKGDETLAVRTRQKLLVDLSGWYIRNSIAMAALLDDIGERVDGLIRPETRSILAALGPEGQATNWLEHMRQLIARAGTLPHHRGGK